MNESENNTITQSNESTNPAPSPAPTPVVPPEKTFTQAELDTIVGKRLAKAMKGVPEKEELDAFKAWKESQQTEKERWNALEKERDTAKADLTAAMAELEQYRREKFLLEKGIPANDVDYFAFKIGKLVTETTSFEKAAEEYLKDNPQAGTMRIDLTAPLGNGHPAQNANETMNSLIRGSRKRGL